MALVLLLFLTLTIVPGSPSDDWSSGTFTLFPRDLVELVASQTQTHSFPPSCSMVVSSDKKYTGMKLLCLHFVIVIRVDSTLMMVNGGGYLNIVTSN